MLEQTQFDPFSSHKLGSFFIFPFIQCLPMYTDEHTHNFVVNFLFIILPTSQITAAQKLFIHFETKNKEEKKYIFWLKIFFSNLSLPLSTRRSSVFH